MLESLIRGLRRAGADVDVVALADALWLARAMGDTAGPTGPPDPAGAPAVPAPGREPSEDPAGPEGTPEPLAPYPSRPEPGTYDTDGVPDGPGTLAAVTGRVRRGSALPDGPALARALRPLRRRRPGGREVGLDVDATVTLYARTDELTPVFTALPERWFRLDLVVDASPSMQVWRDTADDLHVLLRRLGAFSTVRRWTLHPGPDGAPVLHGPAGGLCRTRCSGNRGAGRCCSCSPTASRTGGTPRTPGGCCATGPGPRPPSCSTPSRARCGPTPAWTVPWCPSRPADAAPAPPIWPPGSPTACGGSSRPPTRR